MSSVTEAPKKGEVRYAEAYKRRAAKSNLGTASASKVVAYFSHRFDLLDCGSAPATTEDTVNKLSGVIKMYRENGKEESWIFEVIDQVLEKWDDLSKRKTTTLKGKMWGLGPRPNLRDFVFCHESIVASLECFKNDDMWSNRFSPSSNKVKQSSVVGRSSKIRPTQDELEEAAMDEYYE